jgi:AcrR family transcriptional regulator
VSERSFSALEARRTATEHAIMSAALERFSRRGFHGTSMREIADAAAVSVGNIYR